MNNEISRAIAKLAIPDGKKMNQILTDKAEAKKKEESERIIAALVEYLEAADRWDKFYGDARFPLICIRLDELAKKTNICQYSIEQKLFHPHLLDTMFEANWQVLYRTGFYSNGGAKHRPEQDYVLLIPVNAENWPDFQEQVAIWEGNNSSYPEWIIFGAEFIQGNAWRRANATRWGDWKKQVCGETGEEA